MHVDVQMPVKIVARKKERFWLFLMPLTSTRRAKKKQVKAALSDNKTTTLILIKRLFDGYFFGFDFF